MIGRGYAIVCDELDQDYLLHAFFSYTAENATILRLEENLQRPIRGRLSRLLNVYDREEDCDQEVILKSETVAHEQYVLFLNGL